MRETLAPVGLSCRERHKPAELSCGQRVAGALVPVNDPANVWVDEPTGNLDSDEGKQVDGRTRRAKPHARPDAGSRDARAGDRRALGALSV